MKFKSDIEVQAGLKDSSGSAGTSGQVLSSTVTGTSWINKPASASGTVNYVSKFTAATTLGNSQIFDDGTNVGINTTSPVAKLEVIGDIKTSLDSLFNNVIVGRGGGNLASNTVVGRSALVSNVSGYQNTAIGYTSLTNNTTGYQNVAIGSNVLSSNTTGFGNVSIGDDSLLTNTTGQDNIAIGKNALNGQTGSYRNIAIGLNAMSSNAVSSNNIAIGYGTGGASGSLNIWIGEGAGYGGASNISIGKNCGGNGQENVAIGSKSNRLAQGASIYNIAVGYQSLYNNLTGIRNSSIGANSLYNANSSYNVAFGYDAGRYVLTEGGSPNTNPQYNTYLGYKTKSATNADVNSIVIGYDTVSLGSNTVVIGNGSITTTALRGNVGIGTTSPSQKFQVFGGAGRFDNIGTQLILGTQGVAGAYELAVSTGNALSISLSGAGERMRIDSAGRVGIGTSSPSQVLQVVGNARITGAIYDSTNSAGSSGQILSSTGTGTAWVTGGGGGGISGSGTTNQVPKFTSSTSIGNSNIQDNGSLVTISTDATINYKTVGVGGNNISTNSAFGYKALFSNTTGYDNVALGDFALSSNTTGVFNVATGSNALINNTVGAFNVASGLQALNSNTIGSLNTAIGAFALNANVGDYNIAIGDQAGQYATSMSYSIVLGGYYDPAGNGITQNETLSVGKHDYEAEQYISTDSPFPHFWAPKTVVCVDGDTKQLLVLAVDIYSAIFMDYNLQDENGNARAGTLKVVWNNDGSIIKSTEESTDSIGTTTGLTIYPILSGSEIQIAIDNTNGYTVYVNSTSRLLIRPAISTL